MIYSPFNVEMLDIEYNKNLLLIIRKFKKKILYIILKESQTNHFNIYL